ncbi:hypothetical protein O0L34_g2599 [Tuta absoluta]|nr:hypothetical protein O0L34_g2599 [Tuta absoluta]
MSAITRSPSTTVQTSRSETDIFTVSNCEFVNNNIRSKRPRSELSPDSMKAQDIDIAEILSNQTILMQQLTQDFGDIKIQNAAIQQTNTKIEGAIKAMNANYEAMKQEITNLHKEKHEQLEYIQQLEHKIRDINFKSRPADLEIRNIPQVNSENCESLSKMVENIGQIVGCPIAQTRIRDIYRLPGQSRSSQSNAARPIIVEFMTVMAKNSFLKAARNHNNNATSKEMKLQTQELGLPGKPQPVYISEKTPGSCRKLFRVARDFVKENNYRFCWVKNGNIFLRKSEEEKQVLIKSEKCLQNLIEMK